MTIRLIVISMAIQHSMVVYYVCYYCFHWVNWVSNIYFLISLPISSEWPMLLFYIEPNCDFHYIISYNMILDNSSSHCINNWIFECKKYFWIFYNQCRTRTWKLESHNDQWEVILQIVTVSWTAHRSYTTPSTKLIKWFHLIN